MSFWIILSWIFVIVLTAINIFVFLKLKQASEQMMKMAFPGAKNMNEAMSRMQQMMGGGNIGGINFASQPQHLAIEDKEILKDCAGCSTVIVGSFTGI